MLLVSTSQRRTQVPKHKMLKKILALLVSVNVLLLNWYLLESKQISSHARKTGSWYLLGVLFKIKHSCPLYMGVPPPPPPQPMSYKNNFPESHIINPLLAKLVRSRWLDIGHILFFLESMDVGDVVPGVVVYLSSDG